MKKKIFIRIVIAFIILVILALFIWNIKNNEKFFHTSVAQLITVIVAISVAFLAVQFKNDERKQKENIENILDYIQVKVSQKSLLEINSDSDKKLITVNNRSLNNKIGVLLKYSDKFGFSEDANLLKNAFQDYQEFVGEHISDLEYLKKSIADLARYSENISFRCDMIRLKLYE